MTALVNLYRRQAQEIFTEMRLVSFKPIDPGHDHAHSIANMNYHYSNWQTARNRFSKELKIFLKEVGISYAWLNSSGVDYSTIITVIIVNPTDYGYLKLMADEYDITTSHMLPINLPSFMFHLTDEDFVTHKAAIYRVKNICDQ